MAGGWSRRQVLAGLGAAASAPAAAASAVAPPRNLIVLQVYGGWDTLYSIDPKPDAAWMDAPAGAVRLFGELPIWGADTRPATATFFADHHERVAIVHGINVRSVDHVQCLRWLLTGTRDPQAPDACTIAAAAHAAEYPLPFLLLSDRAFLGPYGSLAARAGGVNQLSALVTPQASYAPLDGTVPFEPSAEEAVALEAFRAARAAHPVGTVGSFLAQRTDPAQARDRAEILRGLGEALGVAGDPQTLSAQIVAALDILEAGLSRAVMLDAQVFFDTHADNGLQEKAQEETFTHLSELFGELEARPGRSGGSLFDETVVAVVSEMGRAPTLNAGGGKDHWPFASVLLAGAGVRGDVVLGGTTDDAFLGRKVDLATGAIDDDGGEELYAERFTAGLLAAVGVDPEGWLPGVPPFHGFRVNN